jgi:hypothetical protein
MEVRLPGANEYWPSSLASRTRTAKVPSGFPEISLIFLMAISPCNVMTQKIKTA